jgi:U5 snRNP spliceosome subunit
MLYYKESSIETRLFNWHFRVCMALVIVRYHMRRSDPAELTKQYPRNLHVSRQQLRVLTPLFNECVPGLVFEIIMSQSPQTYSPQPFVYSKSGSVRSPAIDLDTPPPPPPKPSSHEASRRGTPQTGPPLPRPPQSLSQDRAQTQITEGQSTVTGVPSTTDGVYNPGTEASQPQPPSVEEGWLPDIVKDKS